MDEFQKLPVVRIRRPDPYSEIQELQPDPANGGGFQVTEKGAAFFLKDAFAVCTASVPSLSRGG